MQSIQALGIYDIENTISQNYLLSIRRLNTSDLTPEKNNNFKLLVLNGNILVNSGKKILFLIYQYFGIVLLNILGKRLSRSKTFGEYSIVQMFGYLSIIDVMMLSILNIY